MIELALLGPPVLRRSGEASDVVLVQPRRLALLAYLAASIGSLQRRDRLLLLFWGDQPEPRARASLRQALYFLRRSLGDEVLITRGDDEVGLNPSSISVDVRAFEDALAAGRVHDAMALYRGDFLADFNVSDAVEFERWATDKRCELRRGALQAAWQLAESAVTHDERSAAIAWARKAIELADNAEGDVRRAMQMMAGAGERIGALAIFETFRQRLATDLGAVPEAATLALANSLRATDNADVSKVPVLDHAPALAVRSITHQDDAVAPLPLRIAARRTVSVTVGIVAVLLLALTVLHQRAVSAPLDAGEANRVAVFPFTIRSRTAQSGYLREGAATLLGLALDGAGRLRIVDPNAVLSASPHIIDLDAGRRIAASLHAGAFVLGEIEAAGQHLTVAATLYDASGRVSARASAVGDETRVFDLVDSLARHLAIGTMTDSTVRLANVASTSTRSLPSFKSFLVGETQMRAGHYREAVTALLEAVAADSTFGLAYYRLSLAREWTSGEISSDSAAALAEHFSAHLPARDRKLLAARRAVVRRHGVESERLVREVLADDPTDADAWSQLGEIRFHLGPNVGRSIDEAREAFLTVLRYRPNDLAARVHLTRIAARSGDTSLVRAWSGGDAWSGDAWSGDASGIGMFELAAMRAVVLGDVRAQGAIVAAATRATDLSVTSAVWRLAVYSGDPEAAALAASRERGQASDADVLMTDITRGHLGAPKTSDAALRQQHAVMLGLMLSLPSAPDLPALAQRAHVALGQILRERSDSTTHVVLVSARMLEARYAELSPIVALSVALLPSEKATVLAISEAIHVTADPSRALRLITPDKIDEPTLFRNGLYDIVASIRAEAAHQLHRDDDAIEWLRSIGMNSSGSSAAIAFATRRIAVIEDARGAHAVARPTWVRFAKMWRSCDVELQPLLRNK